MTNKLLHVANIRTDGGAQMRAELHAATVAEYAAEMSDGWGDFPPVVACYDGAAYWLVDGYHRLAAFRRARPDDAHIPASILAGDRRAAILHAAGANAQHGLRRSDADKRRAVETLLADDEWGKWSDREIARRCLVSPTFVATVRKSVTVHVDSDRTYTNRHGASAVMHTANIGGNSPAYNTHSAKENLQGDTGAGPVRPPRCLRCKRPLTDPESIAAGIGPCCRTHGHHIDGDGENEQEMDAQTPLLPVSLRNGYDGDEWYTPPDVIAAARVALGGHIELDPASCDLAQTVVNAGCYYTRRQDGLKQAWDARTLWLNPPYSDPSPWVDKIITSHERKRVATAIVLVNNATETAWFQHLLFHAPIFCLPAQRMAFWRADHSNVGARQGQAIFYFGEYPQTFARSFAHLGRSYVNYL